MTPDPPADRTDLRKLFEVWVDSDLKAQVIVFYNNNPGVIETVEGLARRLGLSPASVRQAVTDHVKLGLLQERKVGDKTLLVFNPETRAALGDRIVAELERRLRDLGGRASNPSGGQAA